jgi:hypothetical protein
MAWMNIDLESFVRCGIWRRFRAYLALNQIDSNNKLMNWEERKFSMKNRTRESYWLYNFDGNMKSDTVNHQWRYKTKLKTYPINNPNQKTRINLTAIEASVTDNGKDEELTKERLQYSHPWDSVHYSNRDVRKGTISVKWECTLFTHLILSNDRNLCSLEKGESRKRWWRESLSWKSNCWCLRGSTNYRTFESEGAQEVIEWKEHGIDENRRHHNKCQENTCLCVNLYLAMVSFHLLRLGKHLSLNFDILLRLVAVRIVVVENSE